MRIPKRLWAWGLLGLWVLLTARTLSLHLKTRTLLAREIPRNVGMGDSLQAVVEGLERELADRLAYAAPDGRDPLALKRVVKVALPAGGANENAEAGRMRLSATLVSPGNSMAIIKYQGRSHTLRVGDTLDHRVIKAIDKKTVVLEHHGKAIVLVNQPAPQAEIQSEGGKRRLEELQL